MFPVSPAVFAFAGLGLKGSFLFTEMERSAPCSRPSPTGLVFFSLCSPGSSGGACVLCSWVNSCGDMGPQLPRPTPPRQGRPGCSYSMTWELLPPHPPAPLPGSDTPAGRRMVQSCPHHSSLSWSLAALCPGLCPATLRRPLGVPVPTSACDAVTKQHAGLGASSFLSALASRTRVPSSDKLLSLCPLATGVMLSALSTRPLSWAHPHVS